MGTKQKPLEREALDNWSWGTHIGLFYETEQDLLEMLALYFKPGLAGNEYCLWIHPNLSEARAVHALRQVIPSLDQHLEKGDIEILASQEWYSQNDEFKATPVLQAFDTKLTQALKKGYMKMRVVADASWLDHEHWNVFSDYERQIEERFSGKPISILCAYPTVPLRAADILDVAQTHRFIATRRNGNWEILEAPKWKHANAGSEAGSGSENRKHTQQARKELEDKVQARTADLGQINKALKAEIIEQKRSEEALQRNEYRLQAAIEAANILLWERDYSSGQLTWLGHYEEILGFAPGEFDGTLASFEERVHPEDIEGLRQVRQRALEEGSGYRHEYRIVWPDGSIHWIAAQGKFIYNEAGRPERMYGATLDITERKQAEEALRKSEANFRTLAEKSLQGIVIYQDNKIVYVNPAHSAITGYSIEELKSMSLEQIISIAHPLDRGIAFERARQRLAAEQISPSLELRIIRKDSVTRWIQTFNNNIEYYGRPAILSTTMDITERKQLEEHLRKAELQYRTLVEHVSPIIYISGLGQHIGVIYISPRIHTLGFTQEEWLADPELWLRQIHVEDQQRVLDGIAEGKEAGGVIQLEYRILARDGSIHWFLDEAVDVTDENGNFVFRQGIMLDITERKRAEEAIRKSEQVLREAESLGHTGSWEQNLITGQLFNTEENLRLFFGDDCSKGANFEDYAQVVHPDDRDYVLQRRVELLEEEGPGDIEYRVIWPDGSIHVIFGRATVVRDELGQATRVYGTNVDITERKQAEEALRLSEQRFHLLTESIPILVWSARADGVSDYYNARFLQYLGKTLEEMQGWVWVDTLHPDDRERSSALWTQAFSSGSDYEIEYRIRRAADGQYRWHLGRAVPLRDSSRKIVRWYGTCTDIHDRKQAEEKIRQYVAQIEALAELSRTFVEAGLDYRSILDTVARRTAEMIGDSCVITLFSDDAQRSFPVASHHPNPKAFSMMREALLHTWQGGTDAQRYQGLLAGHSIYVPSVNPEEFRASLEPQFWDYFETVGISSVLIVPLQVQGRVIGTLGLTRDREGNPYTHDDRVLLQNIADRAAMSIQNARLFEQVQGAREQLEALSRRILEVQEAERRALTTELHDRVGQNLTGLSINLQNMKALLSGEEAQKLTSKFEDAQALVEDTTRQIRDIMAELYLPELEDYGLAAALETYAERVASRGDLELIADLPDLTPPLLPMNVRIALFRAAQEAISNVLKHADATQLKISLHGKNGRIRLRVEDNGQGFEPEAVSQKEPPSWGLQIMRGRIEAIGGRVQIESKSGQGTLVTFEIERMH